MTASAYRRQRGNEAQTLVAGWYAAHGWPYAEPTGAGRQGADVTGLPGLAPEIKAARDFRLASWLKQARDGRNGLAYVVYRGNGLGEAKLGQWPVIMRLDDHTELLRAAGYGDTGTMQKRKREG